MDALLKCAAPFRAALLVIATLAFTTACHPGATVNGGPKPPNVGGTISGTVTADGVTPIAGRKVTATDEATGQAIATTTSDSGGYTMRVPKGKYRLAVELKAGEMLTKQPVETEINVGDLDPGRDFVVTARP